MRLLPQWEDPTMDERAHHHRPSQPLCSQGLDSPYESRDIHGLLHQGYSCHDSRTAPPGLATAKEGNTGTMLER